MEQTIGFIGFGNMAQAMAAGWLKTGAVPARQMVACAKNWDKLCRTAGALGITPCHNAEEVAARADVVILAVKPYQLQEVTAPILEHLKGKTILSVAVGYPFDKLETLLPGLMHWSLMPNTPVAVGQGVILGEVKHSLSEEAHKTAKELLSAIAMVEEVETDKFGIAGTITGCGPAFVSQFIEALGDAAVLHGLPRATAYRLAGQMVAGTGQLLVESGQHPAAMKDAVCSPGGTTIVGVAALERGGLRAAVIDAIDAIQKK